MRNANSVFFAMLCPLLLSAAAAAELNRGLIISIESQLILPAGARMETLANPIQFIHFFDYYVMLPFGIIQTNLV